MDEKRGPKGVPIRLGDEHGDDEATVLDLSLDGVREALEARRAEAEAQDEDADEGDAWGDAAPPRRPPPPSVADDDPEKTEMIERPDLGMLQAEVAPRGVVPLGADAAKLVGKSKPPDGGLAHTDLYPAVTSDEGETVLMTRPSDAPPVRALEDLSLPSIGSDLSDDKTLSRPKIARMTFRPNDASAPPRPLPPAVSGRQRPAPAPEPTAEIDAAGLVERGTLVVDAPPDAAVFVDGVERGSGRVEVRELDRFARVAVRVHRPGYKPWTRTVSLDGKPEVRVAPELEPR